MATKKATKKVTIGVGARVVAYSAERPRLIVMGEIVALDRKARIATLREPRCAVYYDRDTRGPLGLATRGPGPGSRISGTHPDLVLEMAYGDLAVATPEAIARWEAQPWA